MASPFRFAALRSLALRFSALSSIGGQIVLLIVLVIGIVATVNVITSSVQQHQSGEAFTLSQVRAIGQVAAAGSGGGLAFGDRDFLEKSMLGIERLSNFEFLIIKNRAGDTAYTKNFREAPPELRVHSSLLSGDSLRTYFDDIGRAVAIAPVTAPVSMDGSDKYLGEVIVVVNTSEMNATIMRSRNSIIAGSSFAALFCVVAAFFVVRRIVRPIQDLSHVAKRVSAGNLTQRASTPKGSTAQSEVGILTDAFNDMLDTLEAANEEMQSANLELASLNRNLVLANEQAEMRARELALANERIQKQNLELQDLSLEKDEFLGIAAHDLKNPLGAIQSMAELMTSEPYSAEELQSFAQIIRNSAVKMFGLIRNLLDVNAIERGGRKFACEKINLASILLRTLEFYEQRAAEKFITLHYDHPIPKMFIIGDSLAVGQVLDNLISNAVKYSPHGKNVYVRIKNEGDRTNNETSRAESDKSSSRHPKDVILQQPASFVRVEVQDEGQGISPVDMKKLFGKFARLTARPTGGEHSTGLGLSIVKKMVEAMNGNVWCESELGKGAMFIVELPSAEEVDNNTPAIG